MDDVFYALSKNTLQSSEKCEPCFKLNVQKVAIYFCEQCEEYLCSNCTQIHGVMKATESHTPITMNKKRLKDAVYCEQCGTNDEIVKATHYCSACNENLCNSCRVIHQRTKATKAHALTTIKDTTNLIPQSDFPQCDPCKEGNEESPATHHCRECDEYLCNRCLQTHKRITATRDHRPNDLFIHAENDTSSLSSKDATNVAKGTNYFFISKEFRTNECASPQEHKTKSEYQSLLDPPYNLKSRANVKMCDACASQSKSAESQWYCEDLKKHSIQMGTSNHFVVSDLKNVTENRLGEVQENKLTEKKKYVTILWL